MTVRDVVSLFFELHAKGNAELALARGEILSITAGQKKHRDARSRKGAGTGRELPRTALITALLRTSLPRRRLNTTPRPRGAGALAAEGNFRRRTHAQQPHRMRRDVLDAVALNASCRRSACGRLSTATISIEPRMESSWAPTRRRLWLCGPTRACLLVEGPTDNHG